MLSDFGVWVFDALALRGFSQRVFGILGSRASQRKPAKVRTSDMAPGRNPMPLRMNRCTEHRQETKHAPTKPEALSCTEIPKIPELTNLQDSINTSC